MAYLNSFCVLQQRSALLTHVDLCTAMDLIAVATNDSLSLHRTITWERVYFEKSEDAFEGKTISALSFSCIGKCLSVGFTDGTAVILDIETSDVLAARYNPDSPEFGPVLSFAWQRISYDDTVDVENRTWLFGGLNQIQRGGMAEYSDPGASNLTANASDGISISLTSPVAARRELVVQLAGHIHLSLTADGSLHGHIIGVFPLFRVQLFGTTVLHGNSLIAGSYAGPAVLCSTSQGVVHLPFNTAFTREIKWLEQGASLHLCIESNLARLQELIVSCGRKWKDTCKVILPKLSLLQTLLDTYELRMTPIEFCYSITLCGLWHPAAATAFSQHWNDQGLQRLRAGVDATSRSVIKLLQTKALPMATNCLLAARELLAVQEHLLRSRKTNSTDSNNASHADSSSPLLRCKQLVQTVERVILKIDEALLEARLARDAMLLYIQFIKDCAYDVAASENTTTVPGVKPDIALRSKYQVIFDPRCRRASNKGAAAQAEHVTGTHLFEYLQDSAMVGNIGSNSGAESTDKVTEIYEAAAAISDRLLTASLSTDSSVQSVGGQGPVKHTPSIVYEIKMAKELAESLFVGSQAHTSMALAHSNNSHDKCAVPLLTLPVLESTTIRQATQSLRQLTLKCGEDETTLSEAVLRVCAHSDVLYITAQPLNTGKSEVEVGGSVVYVAAIATSSLLQGLTTPASSKKHSPSWIEQCTVTVAIYSKASSGDNDSEASVLVGLEIPQGESEGVFVCKIPLEDVSFTEIESDEDAHATLSDMVLSTVSAQPLPEDFKARKVGLKNIFTLRATGERGVALVADAAGKIVVLDLEGEEDESEQASDEGSNGKDEEASDNGDDSMDQS